MIKVILLAVLCVLTFFSCAGSKKSEPDENEVVAAYSWGSWEEDLEHTAFVMLMNDGTFQFTFSPLSSYIGHGSYTMEDGKLILETSDGEYVYTFDMAENSIVFDGENSSDFTWYSDFEDGDVFTGGFYDKSEK